MSNKIKTSLLDKAKSVKSTKKRDSYTKEQVDLAIAWTNDEVSLTQVATAIEASNTVAAYVFLAFALAKHIKSSKK